MKVIFKDGFSINSKQVQELIDKENKRICLVVYTSDEGLSVEGLVSNICNENCQEIQVVSGDSRSCIYKNYTELDSITLTQSDYEFNIAIRLYKGN